MNHSQSLFHVTQNSKKICRSTDEALASTRERLAKEAGYENFVHLKNLADLEFKNSRSLLLKRLVASIEQHSSDIEDLILKFDVPLSFLCKEFEGPDLLDLVVFQNNRAILAIDIFPSEYSDSYTPFVSDSREKLTFLNDDKKLIAEDISLSFAYLAFTSAYFDEFRGKTLMDWMVGMFFHSYYVWSSDEISDFVKMEYDPFSVYSDGSGVKWPNNLAHDVIQKINSKYKPEEFNGPESNTRYLWMGAKCLAAVRIGRDQYSWTTTRVLALRAGFSPGEISEEISMLKFAPSLEGKNHWPNVTNGRDMVKVYSKFVSSGKPGGSSTSGDFFKGSSWPENTTVDLINWPLKDPVRYRNSKGD